MKIDNRFNARRGAVLVPSPGLWILLTYYYPLARSTILVTCHGRVEVVRVTILAIKYVL